MRLDYDRLLKAEYPCPPRPGWADGTNWSTLPTEASMLHDAVLQLMPRRVVESGTFTGVGTRTLARALQEIGGGTVDTVDFGSDHPGTEDYGRGVPRDEWERLPQIRERMLDEARRECPDVEIRFHLGHTHDMLPKVLASIGTWDFWFQDSGHNPEDILGEWDIMAPRAGIDALAVLDDINPDHAIRTFRPEEWEVHWFSPYDPLPLYRLREHSTLWLQKH